MTCGIYAIVNKVDGKRYVGKSINIEARWGTHLRDLRREVIKKNSNRHLFNAFKEYGESNFGFEYLETVDNGDDDLLSFRELFWMDHLGSCNRIKGYNLRRDSSGKCIVQEETRKIISEKVKGELNPNYGNKWTIDQKAKASATAKELHKNGRYDSDETKRKHSEQSVLFWKENPEVKEQMRHKVSVSRTTYKIAQYDKNGVLVKVWDRMLEILENNPDFFRIAIYNCCNGYKKTYRGFVWKKVHQHEG